jgi:hypothetical protein
MSTALRIVAVAFGLLVLAAAPAAADASVTVTSTIGAGNNGTPVGTATLTRTVTSSGERLTVDAQVPGGIKDSALCLSSEPFTERVSAGQCPYSQGNTGTTVHYDVPVPDSISGALYVQFHIRTQGATAFAGWQPAADGGGSFYGNVAVPDPSDGTPVPVTALGGVALAAVLSVTFLVRRAG